jgi:hypothetical protein
MMGFNEVLPKLPVKPTEIKTAYSARKPSVPFLVPLFGPADQCSIPLFASMESEGNPSFREALFLFLFTVPWLYLGSGMAGAYKLGNPMKVIPSVGELIPNVRLKLVTPAQSAALIGWIKSQEVTKLHVDAIRIAESIGVGFVWMNWQSVQDFAEPNNFGMLLTNAVRRESKIKV